MSQSPSLWSVIDLHCDLLYYLAHVPRASLDNINDIGVALPHLKAGNVKIQTLAMFTLTKPGSAAITNAQVDTYLDLLNSSDFKAVSSYHDAKNILDVDQVGIVPAIENASGLCEEDESISLAFQRLDHIQRRVGKILYISLTHHTENRFGGGNYSDNIGLKDDGKALLDYMDGKKICIDLAHTSDALAYGILDHLTKNNLDVPVIASHSNFRPICNHVRNLPDELAQEVISRNGLIGINFLRAYINNEIPERIYDHILYGLKMGAKDQLALGADFFNIRDFPDSSRHPLFFDEHGNAGKYPEILEKTAELTKPDWVAQFAWGNGVEFLGRIWGKEK